MRIHVWPEDDSRAAFEELRSLSRHDVSEDDWPCWFVEVTVGRRHAGLFVVWEIDGKERGRVSPIPKEERPDPPADLFDDAGWVDLTSLSLWFACDLEGIAFDPIETELKWLRHQRGPALRLAVAERYGWTCHICGVPLPLTARDARYDAVHPNPQFGDVEHVVPLAAGGLHYMGNLRIAHHQCNLRKGATYRGAGPPLLLLRRRF